MHLEKKKKKKILYSDDFSTMSQDFHAISVKIIEVTKHNLE